MQTFNSLSHTQELTKSAGNRNFVASYLQAVMTAHSSNAITYS